MGFISSYRKRFANAKKAVSNEKREMANIMSQIDSLQSQIDDLQTKYSEHSGRLEVGQKAVIDTGMLLFSKEKRCEILDEAEHLCYSKKTIERLRLYTPEQWNQDNVNEDIISDFEAAERFIYDNKPHWKHSIIYRIGSAFDSNER